MKINIKYILPVVAMVAFVHPALAQSESVRRSSDRAPADRASSGRVVSDRPLADREVVETDFDMQAFRARLRNALNLSEDQVAILRQLRAELQARLQDIREEVNAGIISREERRSMVLQIMNSHRQSRDVALTPEQVALLDRAHRYLAERRLQSQRDRPHHRFERLASALELTPDQARKWRDLLQQQRASLQGLRETEEVPSREKIHQLRLDHKATFEAILTEEQLVRFYDIQQRRHAHQQDDDGRPDVDEFPAIAEEDPATSVGARSWGEVKEESR